MALDANTFHKPFRKLRKLLKRFPDTPSPEDVHDVRTQTRRIEAVVGAFQLDDRKAGNKLVKSLKPIRKAAGDVRDMDVLTDLAASLDPNDDKECRLQLMEHLAARRTKAAGKLAKKVGANGKEVRSSLKEAGKFAEAGLDAGTSRNVKTKEKRKIREKSANSMASSFDIEQELRAWPKLNAKNIHSFRLKVKEWRYVLQVGQESDSRLLDELGRVKDQIGLWHDWNELSGIAAKALDHGSGCSVMAQIRSRTKKEFEKALETANAFRAQYLPTEERRARKKGVVTEIHPAVARATSRLASAS